MYKIKKYLCTNVPNFIFIFPAFSHFSLRFSSFRCARARCLPFTVPYRFHSTLLYYSCTDGACFGIINRFIFLSLSAFPSSSTLSSFSPLSTLPGPPLEICGVVGYATGKKVYPPVTMMELEVERLLARAGCTR